jgi:hypothetical protein
MSTKERGKVGSEGYRGLLLLYLYPTKGGSFKNIFATGEKSSQEKWAK